MGLFDSLGDISMGYLARQREVQDKEADEAYQQNKSSIGNLSKFWTAAMEGARQDPEVQQALLSRIAEISQLDPRKVKPKDIQRLADASLLWQGVKRSPESMQPKMDTMQAEVQQPSIPLPKPPGMDGSAPLAGGLTSGAQMPAMNLESNIPLPAPPTEYMSVYPSQDELDFKKYGQEEAGAENALKRALAKKRGELQLEQEFAGPEAADNRIQLRNPEFDVLDSQGNVISKGTPKEPTTANLSGIMGEYEYYLKHLAPGEKALSFTEYQNADANRKRQTTPVFMQQMQAADASNLTPQFQNAINMAGIRVPQNARPQLVKNVEGYLKNGNVPGAKNYLRQTALQYEPVDIKNKVGGRREATRHMEDISEILKTVPTGMLQGTVEQTANYLGKTSDPKLKTLGTRLLATMQAYRRSITGAAFSEGETGEYAQFWPSFKNDLPTNQATIQGLREKFRADDDVFWFSLFQEPGWTDADINPQGSKGKSNFINAPTPPGGGGGTSGGGATGNVTRRKIDAQGNVIK